MVLFAHPPSCPSALTFLLHVQLEPLPFIPSLTFYHPYPVITLQRYPHLQSLCYFLVSVISPCWVLTIENLDFGSTNEKEHGFYLSGSRLLHLILSRSIHLPSNFISFSLLLSSLPMCICLHVHYSLTWWMTFRLFIFSIMNRVSINIIK